MKASEIISEIEEVVKSFPDVTYDKWRIGRANDAADANNEHGNPDSWRDWDADSDEDATKAVEFFVDKGMRKEGSGYGDADFVYVFFAGSPQE